MKLHPLFWCLIALVPLSTAAAAQQATGTLSGIVKDAYGAPLKGVKVTVSGSSPARTAITTDKGTYQLAAMRAGTFTIKFELSGFNALTRQGVTVQPAIKTTVDAAMGSGAMQGSVIVGGDLRTLDPA